MILEYLLPWTPDTFLIDVHIKLDNLKTSWLLVTGVEKVHYMAVYDFISVNIWYWLKKKQKTTNEV